MSSKHSTQVPSISSSSRTPSYLAGIAIALVLATIDPPPAASEPRHSIAVERINAPTSMAHAKVETGKATTNALIAALGASARLTDDAIDFAERASALELILPPPILTDDGEIMFYARRGQLYLDLGIHGDGSYSFYCRDSQGNESSSDEDILINAGIDPALTKVLQEIG